MEPKRIKYIRINLNKDVKDLYTENLETLKKEIEDTNKWKEYSNPPLSTVSFLQFVTHGQLWSENIKWKIPEIKNP